MKAWGHLCRGKGEGHILNRQNRTAFSLQVWGGGRLLTGFGQSHPQRWRHWKMKCGRSARWFGQRIIQQGSLHAGRPALEAAFYRYILECLSWEPLKGNAHCRKLIHFYFDISKCLLRESYKGWNVCASKKDDASVSVPQIRHKWATMWLFLLLLIKQ